MKRPVRNQQATEGVREINVKSEEELYETCFDDGNKLMRRETTIRFFIFLLLGFDEVLYGDEEDNATEGPSEKLMSSSYEVQNPLRWVIGWVLNISDSWDRWVWDFLQDVLGERWGSGGRKLIVRSKRVRRRRHFLNLRRQRRLASHVRH